MPVKGEKNNPAAAKHMPERVIKVAKGTINILAKIKSRLCILLVNFSIYKTESKKKSRK